MRKCLQKALSGLLTLSMMLALLPTQASAAEPGKSDPEPLVRTEDGTAIDVSKDSVIALDNNPTGTGSVPGTYKVSGSAVRTSLEQMPEDNVYQLFSSTGSAFTDKYYDQLDTESKAVYNMILNSPMASGPYTGSYMLPFTKTYDAVVDVSDEKPWGENGPYGWSLSSDINVDDWLVSIINPAEYVLRIDHPELSWLEAGDGQWIYYVEYSTDVDISTPGMGKIGHVTAENITFSFSPSTSVGTISNVNSAIAVARSRIKTNSSTTVDTLRGIHDYVLRTVSYATGDINLPVYQTAYSALTAPHITVCSGYAKMFKVLCDAYGIPCVEVFGYSNGESHAWNYVKVSGNWYAVDCTWDDSATNRYTYFLVGSNTSREGDIPSFGQSHSTSNPYCSGASFNPPVLSTEEYPITFYDEGTGKNEANDNNYLITVVDRDGNPLSGAIVTYGGHVPSNGITDRFGSVRFYRYTLGEPRITVSLEGYSTWTNENSNWTKSDEYCTTIILYPESTGDLKLQTARYWSSDGIDLLTTTKKLNLKTTSAANLAIGNFSIVCSAVKPSAVKEYQLWQNTNQIATSSDGNFSLNVSDGFVKGGGCYIRVYSNDGRTADTNINLTFEENSPPKEIGLSILRDKISFTVPKNVPFVGGNTFELDNMKLLPVEMKWTEDKIYFGINTNIWKSSDISSQDATSEFKSLKKNLDRFKSSGNVSLLNGSMNEHPDLKLPGGDVHFNVIGYAEADYGSSIATGELYIICNATTPTIEFTTLVSFVPITVHSSGSIEICAGAKLAYDWKKQTISGRWPLTITLALEAFGGVCAGDVIGVGAYGKATMPIKANIAHAPFWEGVSLTGELGLKAYFKSVRVFVKRNFFRAWKIL